MSNKQDYVAASMQFLRMGKQLNRDDYKNGDLVFFSSRRNQIAGFGFFYAGGILLGPAEQGAYKTVSLMLDDGADIAFYGRDDARLRGGKPTVNVWYYKEEIFKRLGEMMNFSSYQVDELVPKDMIFTGDESGLMRLVLWDEALQGQYVPQTVLDHLEKGQRHLSNAIDLLQGKEGPKPFLPQLLVEDSVWLVRVFQKPATKAQA